MHVGAETRCGFLWIIVQWHTQGTDRSVSMRLYQGFDDETNEQRQVTLATLRGDIEANAGKNERAYDKIRDKMAAK